MPGRRGHRHGRRSPARHHGQLLRLASLTPPMVLVSLDDHSQLLAHVRRTRRFGLNILGVHQAALTTAFTRSGPDKSDGIAWSASEALPRLPSSVA
ncbi:flavin reductase family protein [Streptomyces sp. 2A115]|uniref:flavin reductase family protein n=1 Tax=Streptomyces sp. 2A115 TaxID=3457439 RepID=UPI003FD2EECB